jgi:hypothetical protein
MRHDADDEASEGNDVGHENARNLSVVAADRPGYPQERDNTDKASYERECLKWRPTGGEEKEQT